MLFRFPHQVRRPRSATIVHHSVCHLKAPPQGTTLDPPLYIRPLLGHSTSATLVHHSRSMRWSTLWLRSSVCHTRSAPLYLPLQVHQPRSATLDLLSCLPPQICHPRSVPRSATLLPSPQVTAIVWISHHARQKANTVASCDLEYDPMTFSMNLTCLSKDVIPVYQKINFLDKGFRKLSYYRCHQNY